MRAGADCGRAKSENDVRRAESRAVVLAREYRVVCGGRVVGGEAAEECGAQAGEVEVKSGPVPSAGPFCLLYSTQKGLHSSTPHPTQLSPDGLSLASASSSSANTHKIL